MTETLSADQLRAFLRRRHGLKLPTTASALAVLDNPNFMPLFAHNQEEGPSSQLHRQGLMVKRLCVVFTMIEFGIPNVDDLSGERGPLSADYLRQLEYNLNDRKKPRDECRHEDILREFIKVMLTARRDFLADHPEAKTGMPSDLLVRKIHSCLLQFKWKDLKGYKVPAEKNDRWLGFDIGLEETIDSLRKCHEHRRYKDSADKGDGLHGQD